MGVDSTRNHHRRFALTRDVKCTNCGPEKVMQCGWHEHFLNFPVAVIGATGSGKALTITYGFGAEELNA